MVGGHTCGDGARAASHPSWVHVCHQHATSLHRATVPQIGSTPTTPVTARSAACRCHAAPPLSCSAAPMLPLIPCLALGISAPSTLLSRRSSTTGNSTAAFDDKAGSGYLDSRDPSVFRRGELPLLAAECCTYPACMASDIDICGHA